MSVENFLVCPYCKESLKIRFFKNSKFGTASCTCDEYPVVEGILYLTKNDFLTNRTATRLLKKRKFDSTVWECLKFTARTHKVIVFGCYLLKRYLGITTPLIFLLKILAILGPSRDWFGYLLNREKRKDIHLALRLVEAQEDSSDLFLDLGFGIGSFYKLMKEKIRQLPFLYVGVDKSFLSLLIAKICMKEKNALFICSDIEAGIPMKNDSAHNLLLLDTFWQLGNKNYVLSECQRVLKGRGSLYIINIYETTPRSYLWGYGIKAEKLNSLLKKYFKKIKFMNNSLNPKGQIAYLPFSEVPKDGYSVWAKEK
jgi:ubiquinone/menaquinone biosynthesis C-methylase UbiE/uncharacterized protein YbaR (Trm112 family)